MKAVALFSGGLDSVLAARLVKDQGIEVIAVKFLGPFSCEKDFSGDSAKRIGVKLVEIPLEADYLRMIRKPKFGYGSGINPCIDCKIFMFRKAWAYARRIGAKFLVTGEVLGERPMSQNMRALRVIEKEAGVSGYLLRPLSARLLPETEPEKRGWIDRKKLLSVQGRSRKIQMELARKWKIREYPTPAGGCLLTYREFAKKCRDLFGSRKKISLDDVELLKHGRHFRFGANKVVVGRHQEDNRCLARLAGNGDYVLYVPGYGSPITILQGPKTKKAIDFAASLTAAYSDHPGTEVVVKYGKHGSIRRMMAKPVNKSDAKKHMLS
jgi:hypothetical protein